MVRSSLLIVGLGVLSLLGPVLVCFGQNSLVIAVSDEPPSLDPTTNASAAIDQILNQNVYEGLVRVTARGEIEPALASSFEISPDGLTYTFFLRRGVVFHNAHPFTAADVTATFTRDMDEKTGHPHREYYATIEKITTPDPYTVVFHMTRVDAAFLSLLALGDSVILPEEGSSDLAHHPVGTGPFRFVEWSVGDHLRLERFGDYYREGVPLLDEVTFRFIPDAASQLAALLSGDVDLVARVPAEIALSVKDDPRYLMVAGPQNLVQILAINNEREPFTDLLVRQAIACAIDRDAIIEGTMFGMGSPIGSHLTPASPYYTDLTGLYPYDPQHARDLLAQAGYPDGFSATLTLPQNYEIHVRTGEIIADQLSRVGIDLEIELVEWGQWLARVYSQANYDLTVIGHIGKLDPGAMLGSYGAGKEGYYFRQGYDNPVLDDLLAEGRTTVDEARRHEIYKQAQEIIASDVVNVFIQDPYQIFIMKKNLTGFQLYPIYLINVIEISWSS
jgi:peptide/nickel transport system substrate-binding protein